MGVINISDKLSNEKPKLQIGEKEYEINNSMETMAKFEELLEKSTINNMEQAVTVALGEGAQELDIRQMSLDNFKVVTTAILAGIQGITYEEAEARFHTKE